MGNYKFSRRIGRGGMAEVFMGMREGLGGFEKLVVIKRIFPHFCEDERFIKMFLDEARLAASIRHPNVVEILDINRDESGYFIVMEYLSGENLALIFETLRAQKVTMPAPIVARVGADIAAGLHYAHTATDNSGKPLEIVHRDVTPSNMIVCFSGTTKIVDFGIAKAQVRDSHTRSGALKGKMSYLSPEQVEDSEVDARTDVFQLGIVLHEMLTGTRLFDAEGDHQKMMAVMERPIRPPSEVNPYVPKIFDDVVLRALHRDVSKRTQSADQLRRELEYALKQLGTTVSDHDVSDWMQTTFRERYGERVAMERDSVSQMRAGAPVNSDSRIPVVGAANGGKTPTLATVVARPTTKGRQRRPSRPMPRALLGLGGVLGVVFGVVLFWSSQRDSGEDKTVGTSGSSGGAEEIAAQAIEPASPPALDAAAVVVDAAPAVKQPTTFIANIRVEPDNAIIEIDGIQVGRRGAVKKEFPIDGATHTVEVFLTGYETQTFEFTDEPPQETVALRRKKRQPRGPGKSGNDSQAGTGSNGKGQVDSGDTGDSKNDDPDLIDPSW